MVTNSRRVLEWDPRPPLHSGPARRQPCQLKAEIVRRNWRENSVAGLEISFRCHCHQSWPRTLRVRQRIGSARPPPRPRRLGQRRLGQRRLEQRRAQVPRGTRAGHQRLDHRVAAQLDRFQPRCRMFRPDRLRGRRRLLRLQLLVRRCPRFLLAAVRVLGRPIKAAASQPPTPDRPTALSLSPRSAGIGGNRARCSTRNKSESSLSPSNWLG